jgi:hypothetical protein
MDDDLWKFLTQLLRKVWQRFERIVLSTGSDIHHLPENVSGMGTHVNSI